MVRQQIQCLGCLVVESVNRLQKKNVFYSPSQSGMTNKNTPKFTRFINIDIIVYNNVSSSGQHQCLVQLSTLPVAVCYGTGASVKEAQSAAAHNALEYLMIMTKK